MRIGIVVDNEFYHDVRVRNEAMALVKAGHEVHVLCVRRNFHKKLGSTERLRVHSFFFPKLLQNGLYMFMNSLPFYEWIWTCKIRKFIASNSIDCLHVHDLYMSYSSRRSSAQKSIPVILDLHENFPQAILNYKWARRPLLKYLIRPELWTSLEWKYLMRADYFVVLSEFFKSELLTRYPELKADQFIIYPNVQQLDDLKVRASDSNILAGLKKDYFLLCYIGGISQRRGVFLCLDALRIMLAKGKKVLLFLSGPIDKDDRSRFNEYLKEPILKGSIIHYNWIDFQNLPGFINQCDLGLSPIEKGPQHDIGVANKVFQYLSLAKPVIVSDSVSQAELVIKENCGLVFESGNLNDLVNKIEFMMEHPEFLQLAGENGLKAVREKYNTYEAIKKLIGLYSNLMKT